MTAATQTRYRVGGMDCASCAAKIDTAVRRIAGVEDVAVSVMAGAMTVRHAPTTDLAALEKRVAGLGYTIVASAPAAPDGQGVHAPHTGQAHGRDREEACGCGHDHRGHADDHAKEHADTARHSHAGHHHAQDHSACGDDHGHAAPTAADAPAAPAHGGTSIAASEPWWRTRKGALTIACGAALVVAYAIGWLVPAIGPWVFAAAMLVGLIPIARRAIMAAMAGTPFSIEMLMTIAAVGAVIIDASEEAAVVVFLFLVGELLEGVAAGRARDSINALAALAPKTALLEREGKTREVAADTLAIGDVILVRPGDRIPADGVILEGESAIDESPVTGESAPVRKGADVNVFAGTVNAEAALRVRVTASAVDNTIARIVRLVTEAQEAKAPTERFIDRFARSYTPAVVVIAALVAIVPPLLMGGAWAEWIYKGLAILLIGCPCALVISTPAAIAASLSAGARRGLLIKGGAALETLGAVTAVAFDKTGTLTGGKPRVTDIIPQALPAEEILRMAAALETGSSHPLATAILARAAADKVDIPGATGHRALGGKGVEGAIAGVAAFLGSPEAAGARAPLDPVFAGRLAALADEGKSVAVLIVGGAVAGAIAMRDEPRPDAREGVAALHRTGVRTIMLTGDNPRAASAIGKALGVDDVRAGLLPQDKQRIVGELQAAGHTVAKVGDGINDAPALALANVGVAMGGGTDVALETADAAAMHGRVGDIAAMIALSKRAMSNIRQNLTIALGLKALFLVTTILGVTGLWPAILADTGATVLVTLNALRLLGPQPGATS